MSSLSESQIIDIPKGLVSAIEERFQRSVSFFKKRGVVVFVSDRYRFWESFGFVQQSLARVLVDEGVTVLWLDGAGWRGYQPVIANPSTHLTVRQLRLLPGRRFHWVDQISVKWQARQIRQALANTFGRKSFLWVQGGLDDRIASELPAIDAFSLFDDALLHPPGSPLAEKAGLIIAQNRWAEDHFRKAYPRKVILSFPPMELDPDTFEPSPPPDFPAEFPKRVMGYIGTFTPEGFDMTILEYLIRELPNWGFLLAGRTDAEGETWIRRLRDFPNFHYESVRRRSEISGLWKSLSVNLLLYRPTRANCGAFPVKTLEALYFGVPSVATRVPKTSSLDGIIPRLGFAREIRRTAEKLALTDSGRREAFELLFHEMHPKTSLAKVAEFFGP